MNVGTVKGYNVTKGIITSDTTWTKANSPYNLTGNIAIDEGVTLTIESGVIVNLNAFYIQVNGTLIARGSSAERIHMNSGYIEFTETSTGWNLQTDTGSIIEYAILDTRLGLGGGSPLISKNIITKSISVGGGSPIISKNSIEIPIGSDWLGRPSFPSVAIGIGNDNTALIVDNNILGCYDSAAITIGGGSPTIMRNLISNSYGYGYGDPGYGQAGISISENSSPTIMQNTITKNANGISIHNNPSPTITNNNIEDNTNYNLRIASSTQVNINAANNWWGTTDTAKIDEKIWDYNDSDDFNTGKVNYIPFLTESNPQAMPNQNAPIPTPATSPLPSQNPTATPATPQTGLNEIELAILTVLIVIAVLLIVIIGLVLRKRR
jgi:parallel beta-helix repeat protein